MNGTDNFTAITNNRVEFDQYAESYDDVLNQSLTASGEDKHFFAKHRVAWLAQLFADMNFAPRRALDFGCGTGTSIPLLFDGLGVESAVGVDLSAGSLDVAKRTYNDRAVEFLLPDHYTPHGEMDLAFCNGVFHHIPPGERPSAVEYVYRALRPGGIFALWENNPWNLGTRYCMHVNPFDRDAIPLTPIETRRRLRAVGWEIIRTNYLFIFPKPLAWMRWLEPGCASLPLGAQYLVLARRPM